LGGMSIRIARNGWGSQVESFEAPLEVQHLKDPSTPFNGIFIRAPVVIELTPKPDDPPIDVVAQLAPQLLPSALSALGEGHTAEPKVFVALRQGRHFLTTFHPELTDDDRFHDYFVRQCVFADADEGKTKP